MIEEKESLKESVVYKRKERKVVWSLRPKKTNASNSRPKKKKQKKTKKQKKLVLNSRPENEGTSRDRNQKIYSEFKAKNRRKDNVSSSRPKNCLEFKTKK